MNIVIYTAEPENFVPVQLKRAAEELGHTAQILDETKCALLEETAAPTVFLVDAKTLTPVKIDQDTTIIPRMNEHNQAIKLGTLKRLEIMGAKLLNTVESIALCNDKLMSQIVLNKAGLNTPLSFTVLSSDDLETVVDDMEKTKKLKYPAIIKTLTGTHGIGVMKVDSRASLISVAQVINKGHEFMIQEFIDHEQSARIIMIGEHVLAANLRGQPKDKGEFRTNAHLGSETKAYEPDEEEVKMAQTIVELFGCKFCAIDYIIQKEGDKKKLLVLEVNGSPGLENIQTNWPDKDLAKGVISFIADGKPDFTKSSKEPIVEPEKKESDEKEPEKDETADKQVDAQDVKAPADTTPEAEPTQAPATDEINVIEPVVIHSVIDEPVEARVDTGAKTSSLHVDSVEIKGDIVKFKRGGSTYSVGLFRKIKVKNVHGGDSSDRPIIRLDVTIHGQRINRAEFTLTNREKMKFPVLIGRNVIEVLGLPVKVSAEPMPPEQTIDVEEE